MVDSERMATRFNPTLAHVAGLSDPQPVMAEAADGEFVRFDAPMRYTDSDGDLWVRGPFFGEVVCMPAPCNGQSFTAFDRAWSNPPPAVLRARAALWGLK